MWATIISVPELNQSDPSHSNSTPTSMPTSRAFSPIGQTPGFVILKPFRLLLIQDLTMKDLLAIMASHGYAFIFALLFAEAIGLPFPAAIALVAAGAAVGAHTLWGPYVLLTALVALMLGDTAQFWLGRSMGWSLLGFLCRLSINPETCILRSAESFYKRGKVTLVVAKFIPGVNTMAAPLAGSMKMRFWQFLQLDFLGALLYSLTYLAVGYLSRDFLAVVLSNFHAAGRAMEVVVIAALVVYAIYRAMRFRKHRVYRVVPRIQVAELAARLASEDSGKVLIVDVRSHGYYDRGTERIRGSIRIEPNNLEEEIKNLPRDKDIYLYCT
jgi:membrane protein DedA with SNARE-associated domain